jgi:16S rRNA (cytosine1402-N4)-methyltransferase
MQRFHHIPVLLDATVSALNVRSGCRYLDCTLGGGGHSQAILEGSAPDGEVCALDRDIYALQAATERLERHSGQFKAIHGSFSEMASIFSGSFDGILMDLGVSSPQLDDPKRGFSFQEDGPLDMRMDPTQEMDAASWLNECTEAELAAALFKYGEEPRSRQIARAIVAGGPWRGTKALAQCIAAASGYRNGRTHPATRSFQAIRIAVNDELGELESGLESALTLLSPKGRLAVISFHSLEDRVIKHRLRKAAGIGTPRDEFGNPQNPPLGKLVHPKGISGKDQDRGNPRARSARLRAFERNTSPSPIL